MSIIDSDTWAAWLATPAGRYLLEWEQRQFDAAVADLFGEVALQVGMPRLCSLRANRMQLRVRLGLPREHGAVDAPSGVGDASWPEPGCGVPPGEASADAGLPSRIDQVVVERFEELPLRAHCVDLVVLPHVLEFADDPHQTLREVERVLRPEGRVVVCGFNPISLFGARAVLPAARRRRFLPADGNLIGLPRLRDWLKLLGLQIERGRYGCYRPPFASQRWLDRAAFLEPAGDRWWPICGALYMVSAVKRVEAVRLVGPAWRRRALRRPAAAVAARSFDPVRSDGGPRCR